MPSPSAEAAAAVAPPAIPVAAAPAVALVTPVANERDTIERTWADIAALPIDGLVWIPVLDAISTDGTREWLRERAAADPRVRPLDRAPERGLAQAYLAGYREALRLGASKILEIDAGGSHPIARVPELVAALEDVPWVATTRHRAGGATLGTSWRRRLLSRVGTWVGRGLLGIPLSDCTGGLMGFRRETLGALRPENFHSRHHMIQTELKYHCRRLACREIPLVYRGGGSTLRARSVTDAARVTARLLLDRLGLWPAAGRRAP
jgi:dolichol-phosphate mannosyltransferase